VESTIYARRVPVAALLLALAAAGLHAGWNLLVAGARDRESTTAVVLVTGLIAGIPFAAFDWDVHRSAIPYLAAASLFQLAYIALLVAAYARADMSVVYPLARGVAPVLVLVVGVTALGASASPLQAAGVAGVGCGVLLVRGLRLEGSAVRGILLSLAVAGCIAGYTLTDKRGIEHASPLAYLELEMLLPAVVYAGAVARMRGRRALRAACTPPNGLAGVAMFAAYALVLLALQRASAASVAAVRESSVVLATALAAVVLRERVTPVRLAGAAVVACGVALVALG
jgi:drug/metabolite transporter (DMT)-like permease